MQEAGGISTYKAMKAADKRLRVWEKANPNPMTWDEYQRLEQEFLAQYKREDYS